ncbi:hypothetical protein ACIBHX_46515 [Nonomuraea sp. NPDC050536]|uniref:hypothetical protein n=1 Tax=Nonomuraea sp. NPDC050536 TaxID=3364366 RepID=UPI0037C719CC
MSNNDRDLQRAARRRQRHTDEPYQVALAAIREDWRRLDSELRYVLSDEVQAFMRGQGWRGVSLDDVEDMRSWLANRTPTYVCEWCGDDGDARQEQTTLQIIATGYDPDLSPLTRMVGSKRNHARCAPSQLSWIYPIDLPRDPVGIRVPASARPEMEGEFAITAHPVLLPAEPDAERPATREPALLIRIEVTQDHGQGAAAWLAELEMQLWEPDGFDDPMEATEVAEGWSVRIVRGWPSTLAPQWLAVRTSEPQDGQQPDHLYLGALDVPDAWVEAVRGRQQLLLLIGPRPMYGAAPVIDEQVSDDQLAEFMEEGVLLAGYVPLELDERDGQPGAGRDDGGPQSFWSTPSGLFG